MTVISKVLNDAANRLMKYSSPRRYDDIKYYWQVYPAHHFLCDVMLKSAARYQSVDPSCFVVSCLKCSPALAVNHFNMSDGVLKSSFM